MKKLFLPLLAVCLLACEDDPINPTTNDPQPTQPQMRGSWRWTQQRQVSYNSNGTVGGTITTPMPAGLVYDFNSDSKIYASGTTTNSVGTYVEGSYLIITSGGSAKMNIVKLTADSMIVKQETSSTTQGVFWDFVKP